ncbi:hypothetical protein ACFUJU_08035 [Streptomyces sp. NPDC057235]|uniref:hypothetical protein n=1 Tax=Streptomyces sp. NPDC057235 TaxID=3346058 RepID=UPI003632EF7F
MITHRGALVLLRPRRGWDGATYARVLRTPTPHTVRLLVTADSGGRQRGSMCTMPRALVVQRLRGRHRRHPFP